jgi:LmbE family N-acetylglucosaminyl deacetylase
MTTSKLSVPLLVFISLCFAFTVTVAQPQSPNNASETALALRSLGVMGSALYVGAHPDDENTALLAYLARGRGVRTAYLSITRGDGGQNLVGPEKGELLGLIRTQELLAARHVDGAEQFFTRAIDFGFTKSPEETLRLWGHDAALADVVWVLRRFRPDVVISRFPTTGEGGHGQHTASAILAREAFEAASDPTRFPEQLKYVKPWKPKRLLWNSFVRAGGRPAGNNVLSVDIGGYNALLGRSYTEIAAESRTMHKSQGMGSPERRGTALNYFTHIAGEEATSDIFDGVDLTWRRVPGGEAVAHALEQAAREFRPAEIEALVPLLFRARNEIRKLPTGDPLVEAKNEQLTRLILSSVGLWAEAISATPFTTPGADLRVAVTLVNRSNIPMRLDSVLLTNGKSQPVDKEMSHNQPLTLEVQVPASMDYSQPYWLRKAPTKGLFEVDEQTSVGEPSPSKELALVVNATVGSGEKIDFNLPVLFRWTDRIQGELYRPVVIVPEVAVQLEEKVVVFADRTPKPISVVLKNNVAQAMTGTLRLRLPTGWSSTPPSVPVTLKSKDEEFRASFSITPPAGASTATVAVEFEAGSLRLTRGLMEIDYPHIPRQTLFPPAEARLVRTDLRRDGKRIGYVMGAGDEIPAALRQVGYNVVLLSDQDLETALSTFDAIVTGVRAYNTRPRLRQLQDRLLEYVERGGTLIVQYNTPDRAIDNMRLGPYPLRLSRDERVTVEDAPVAILAPQHVLLNAPNKITPADFDGWVQERGLNYPSEWDERYETILESHDPGEKELRGGTLFARVGRGIYIHTSLAFFRQLPAGVPGAYRLFVNMIEAGKEPDR